MKKEKLKALIIAAVLAALTCVATIIIQIPSPMNGYVNLGDAIVLYCAFCLSPLYAAAAAGIGSALADIITGYAYYAPGTFVIKAAMALVAAVIFNKMKEKHEFTGLIAGSLAAEAIMVTGYFGYACLLLGKGLAAAASIPGNLFQAAVGIVAAIAVYKLMPQKAKNFRITKKSAAAQQQ